MKTCVTCGAPMERCTEDVPFRALEGVTIGNVPVDRCTVAECGDYEVVLPRLNELHDLLAAMIVAKTSRLTSAEIRFLRKHMGWSQADLAAQLSVHDTTISHWEAGSKAMGATADRLLRFLVVHTTPQTSYEAPPCVKSHAKPVGLRARLAISEERWQPAAA